MRAHHERGLARWVADTQQDPQARAGILVGSVARGEERDDSDIDLYLVLSDRELDRRLAAGRTAHVVRCDDLWPGGYLDVKYLSRHLLDRAVTEADEPLRASVVAARVLWDHDGGIDTVLAALLDLEAVPWQQRVDSFLAQAWLQGSYFLPDAVRRGDVFGAQWATGHLRFAAARAVLASRRVLFAGPKYLTATLEALELPNGMLAAWHAAAEPDPTMAKALLDVLSTEFGTPTVDDRLSRYILDHEWAWYHHGLPPEYC